MHPVSKQCSELFDGLFSTPDITAAPGFEDVLPFLGGWTRFVQRNVQIVARLHDSGDGVFAAPLVRSVLEHGAAADSVRENPALFQAFWIKAQANLRRVLRAQAASGISMNLGDTTALEELAFTPEERSLQNEASAANLFSERQDLYDAWLQATHLSHASAGTGAVYLKQRLESSAPTLCIQPQIVADRGNDELACAEAFLQCLSGFSYAQQGDPLRSEIDHLSGGLVR